MNMYDIIDKKKNGGELTTEEIAFFVKGFTKGEIPDYQASALLMAICLKHMSPKETLSLTKEMMHSGDVLNLSGITGLKVDKHSTGGVGDKTTLLLAPMLACCGMTVAKMSGRGLGHTGGTIDKLESFSGFRTELSEEEFFRIVEEHGLVVAAQTGEIAPADKKLYALRDVTATVDDISLIASSIMSKKLACGAQAIVLDVKTGSGSFAGSEENARRLAREMVDIGNGMSRKMCAVISDMNQPLGNAVGNALEVKEAIAGLRGEGPEDLMKLCIALGSNLMWAAGLCSAEEGEEKLKKSVSSGRAYQKFLDFIKAQGGDPAQAENPSLLPQAPYKQAVTARQDGFVGAIECREIGMASLLTGAGREIKGAPIDFGAGIVVHKKIGEHVCAGETLATVYASEKQRLEPAAKRIEAAYTLQAKPAQKPRLLYGSIR